MKKICVVTGSRAEYGLFVPILRKIEQSSKLMLHLVVTTMHLSNEYGYTVEEIFKDGFHIDARVENLLASNTDTAVVKSAGLAMYELADVFKRLGPDCVLLLGDRFETHAAATTAVLLNIPVAHIHGGELTYGAMDEQLRHSITKMSHLHFTSTEAYRKRVIQMGERPDTVIVSGAPGLDNLQIMPKVSRAELEKNLGWRLGNKNILFTFHPETRYLDIEGNLVVLESLLKQVESCAEDYSVVFTYANADHGGAELNKKINLFVKKNPEKYYVKKNMGMKNYFSLLSMIDVVIGNSSSGIIEAASFKKPVINVGHRQDGRLRSGNVIDCEHSDFKEAWKKALSPAFLENCDSTQNVYGKGNAAENIVEVLETHHFTRVKMFQDLSTV